MSVIYTGTSGGLFVKSLTDTIGIGATINSAGGFVAATGPEIRRVTGTPNGTISDFGGSLALDVTNGLLWINTTTGNVAGTSWAIANQASVVPSVQTVAGISVGNTAVETVTAVYTIPANTLKAGSRLSCQWSVNVTSTNNTEGLTTRVRLGTSSGAGPILSTTGPTVPAAINWGTQGNITLVTRAAPGAAVGSVYTGQQTVLTNQNIGAVTGASGSGQIINFATNGQLFLSVTLQWTGANANNAANAELFNVTIM